MEEMYTEPTAPAATDPAQIYLEASTLAHGVTAQELKQAVTLFESIPNYQDAPQRVAAVRQQYIELLHKEQAALQAQKAAKLKQYLIYGGIIVGAAALLITIIVLVVSAIQKNNTYNQAMQLVSEENYQEAIVLFEQLEDYRDSENMLIQVQDWRHQQILDGRYNEALQLVEQKEYEAAIAIFEELGIHRDSRDQLANAEELLRLQKEEEARAETYAVAMELLASGMDEDENEAYSLLTELGDYKDVPQLLEKFQLVSTKDSLVATSSSYCDFEEVITYNDMGKVAFISREVELSFNKSYTTEITYTYDDEGRELTASYEYLNILSSQLGDKNPSKIMSFYDDDGRLIERRTIYLDNTIQREFTRWYDENETLLSTKLSDEYLESQVTGNDTYTITCKMVNAEGRVIHTWQETVNDDGTLSGQRNNEATYEYHENGRLSRITTITSPTNSRITSYIYNAEGYLRNVTTDNDYTRYSYDENGNLLTETHGAYSFDHYTVTYTYTWIYAPNAK